MLPAWPDSSSHRTLTNIYNSKNALNTTEEKHPHCMKAVHLLHWMTRAVTSPQEELCGHIASPNVTHTGLYFYLTLSLLVFFFFLSFWRGNGNRREKNWRGKEERQNHKLRNHPWKLHQLPGKAGRVHIQIRTEVQKPGCRKSKLTCAFLEAAHKQKQSFKHRYHLNITDTDTTLQLGAIACVLFTLFFPFVFSFNHHGERKKGKFLRLGNYCIVR